MDNDDDLNLDYAEDYKLLDLIQQDSKQSPQIYKPTAYWEGYCSRITDRIKKVGLSNFRSDYDLTKGYIMCGVYELSKWVIKKDSLIDKFRKLLKKIPLIRNLINHYEARLEDHLGRSEKYFRNYYDSLILFSKKDYSKINDCMFASPVSLPHRKNITLPLIYAINYASLIEEYKSLDNVETIIEVGAGYGALCEVIMKSSNVKSYYLFDLSPMVYIATQYLKQAFPGEVADYSDFKKGVKKKINVLPTWCYEEVSQTFDLFINTASFQEMEKNVVSNYLDKLKAKSVFLMSLKSGHKPNANNQLDVISFDYLQRELIDRGFIKSNVEISKEIKHVTKFGDLELYDHSFFTHKDTIS